MQRVFRTKRVTIVVVQVGEKRTPGKSPSVARFHFRNDRLFSAEIGRYPRVS